MRNRETRMGNRTAKFVSALVGSMIAGLPLAAVSQNAPTPPSTANPATDCLASPKGAASQGQHWYYRLDRTTKQKCWYLRAAGDKDGAKAVQTTQAAADTPSESSASPQQTVQDARAEYVTPRNGAPPKAPNAVTQVAPASPPPAQQPANQAAESSAQQAPASPWPDVPAASTAPEPQPATTVVTATAQPKTKPSKSPAPLPPAAADGMTDKPGGSVQMLLLVIGGALALAGILASVIYRFARRRVRVQAASDRRGHWDDWAAQDHDGSRAPWLGANSAAQPHAQGGPVDFDEVRPQTAQLAAFTREISLIAAQSASVRSKAGELDKADIFNGAFAIEAAPPLAAKATDDKEPAARDEADRNEDVKSEDGVDVDVITAMLERLAKQGPQLPEPSPAAGLANLARNQRGQSAARA
ncbi:hypothetical protein [Bradyrhizobium japonicum]|uniref:hypothetical protein n=1 Tax=Bradyrhizobium japonicum TaxID=375 RepID=UPI0012BD39B7|nr:hypothetical protein [Bradyrhizobium japonicum]